MTSYSVNQSIADVRDMFSREVDYSGNSTMKLNLGYGSENIKTLLGLLNDESSVPKKKKDSFEIPLGSPGLQI